MSHFKLWAAGGYVLLSAIGILVFLYIAYRLLRGIGKLGAAIAPVFGGEVKTCLVSLGVAVLAFPKVLPAFIGEFLSFGFTVFSRIPEGLRMIWWQSIESADSTEITSKVIIDLGIGFFQIWISAFNQAFSRSGILNLPFNELIYLLAIWIVAAQLINAARSVGQADTEATKSKSWLEAMYAHLQPTVSRIVEALKKYFDPVTRKNIVFFAILGIGAYLSIAALAALEVLQQQEASESAGADSLKQRLHSVFSAEVFDLRFPETASQISPFDTLETFISAKLQPAPKDTITSAVADSASDLNLRNSVDPPAFSHFLFNAIGTQLEDYRKRREDILNSWKGLRSHTKQQQERAVQEALLMLEVNSQRRGSREKNEHVLQTSNWLHAKIRSLDAHLEFCLRQINEMDEALEKWSNAAYAYLRIAENNPNLFSLPVQPIQPEPYIRAAQSAFWGAPEAAPPVPARPEFGSYLGPFSVVGGWLLRTESLSLALITGLLGFGLLGAASSRFIRERGWQQQGNLPREPLVADLAGVVLRGVSAAIVVFLAVKGGLAIFAAGESQPNPHMLIFTCFVGAVFSEIVWDWAHRKLTEGLGSNSEESAEAADSQEETDQATEAKEK